ncbi:ubiquitin carboxyl-terminal hydrolase [Pycnococcus provasolii]
MVLGQIRSAAASLFGTGTANNNNSNNNNNNSGAAQTQNNGERTAQNASSGGGGMFSFLGVGGSAASKNSRSVKSLSTTEENEKFFGFENFGNTCYVNSVVQALYATKEFRGRLLAHKEQEAPTEESLLTCLAELFQQITNQRRKTGTISPKKFMSRVRADNELFRSYMHQDAHEFLNFLMNNLCETLETDHRKMRTGDEPEPQTHWRSFVQEIFQGCLTSETKCLQCERVTRRDEPFLDLSLDIEPNASLSACLRKFGQAEVLRDSEKFRCEYCGGGTYQEARRQLRFASAPKVLALHLKRFKYIESLGQYRKLCHRVPFPNTLRIPAEMMASGQEKDGQSGAGGSLPPLYRLYAVVVHLGSGPNHGHYVCLTKSGMGDTATATTTSAATASEGTGSVPSDAAETSSPPVPMSVDGVDSPSDSQAMSPTPDVECDAASDAAWVLFDDDLVEVMPTESLSRFYGATTEGPLTAQGGVGTSRGGGGGAPPKPLVKAEPNTEHGYLLFYARC